MAHIFISSDLVNDRYIDKDIPKILRAAGHEHATMSPLEKIIEASEYTAFTNGGTDLVILVHSTPAGFGTDSPVRVLKKLRGLSDVLVYRNAVKAKSLPAIVIAKNTDLASGDATALGTMKWVKVVDPSANIAQLISTIKDIVFDWRTDLLQELECVGYAVVVGPTGQLNVNPTFKKINSKQVEGEIL